MFNWFRRPQSPSTPAAPAAPMMERLEDRQLMDATAIERGISVRNMSANGFSTNQSTVKIPFDNDIKLVDPSKIRIRGYAVNPLSGGQKKLVINFSDVHVQSDNRTLALTTDRLLRKGARFYFDPGALTDGNDQPVHQHIVRSPKGQNKERFTLASRALKPFDLNKFLPAIYANSPTPTTADDVLLESEVEPLFTAFLEKKVAAGLITQAKMDATLARFNNDIDRQRIPDHNLRAALLSLVGTFAEPAIGVFLDGENLSGRPYTIVAFAETGSGAVIADTEVLDNGRLRTRVKPQFAGEPFQVLSGILAHEAVHQDMATSLQEEIVANNFETTVWAQQLDVDKVPASSGTALVADQNTELLALLNSGRGSFPIVGTLNAPIVNNLTGVFYGAKAQTGGNYTSYDNYVRRQYLARGATSADTPGNPTLERYMTAFGGVTAGAQFSEELITTLDHRLGDVLNNKQAIRVAGHLRLTT